MNRKRATHLLPEEMQTSERLSTKKELAQKGRHPSCPVPVKIRRNLRARYSNKKPTPLCFNNNVALSHMYDAKQRAPYLDQVFSKLGCVGEGSFGKVFRVRSKEDQKLYAVKRLKANISLKDRHAEVKNNEILGYNSNCVQFFMAWDENSYTFMLLEYCDMSLADYSKLNNNIPEELLWNVLYDICKALDFLHKRKFLHLDVKPGNIMMKKGLFKLGDFGLLVDLQSNNRVKKSTLSDGDSKYLALEVLDGIYTTACDIFGLGLSILELATDVELPDHGVLWHQLRHKILPMWFYERVTQGLAIIVERMITSNYKERPSAERVLAYPSLKDIEKRDAKLTRTDFAASYVKADDCFDSLPLSPINNNNNTTTPPFNGKSTSVIYDSDFDDDAYNTMVKDSQTFEGENTSITKISLFKRKSKSNQSSPSFCSSAKSSPLEMVNSSLAQSLGDSGLDFGSNECLNTTFKSEHGDAFAMSSLITSTPVLNTIKKQVKRFPKAKLVFD